MQIRVVTWNIRRKNPTQVLEFFDQSIPTVFLLQEVPLSVTTSANLICSEQGTYGGKNAIYSGTFPLHEVRLEIYSHAGALAIASLNLTDNGRSLTFISWYGVMEPVGKSKYSMTTLHRTLSDLTYLLDDPKYNKQLILGGDLNASIQWDEHPDNWPSKSHHIFFERLKDFNLADCLTPFHSFPVQTLRHHSSTIAWQNDYLFANPNLISNLKSCDVLENESVIKFSDHNPVVAVFDF